MRDPRVWLVIGIAVALLIAFLLLRKRHSSAARRISSLCLVTFTAIVLVFGIVRPFLVGMFAIPSASMVPTLLEGDQIVVNKFVYKFHPPRFQDVIVFKAPTEICEEGCDEDYVKRVIGLPGDVIEVRDGRVFRNNEIVGEHYVEGTTDGDVPPYRIPDGTLFMMGDNRGNSFDSRDWGTLKIDRVIGQATFIFAPLKRMGYIR